MQAHNVQALEIEQIAQCVWAPRRDLGLQPGDRDSWAIIPVFPHRDPRYRSGVGIMLLNARGEVFVGQRIRNGNRTWQMPQEGSTVASRLGMPPYGSPTGIARADGGGADHARLGETINEALAGIDNLWPTACPPGQAVVNAAVRSPVSELGKT